MDAIGEVGSPVETGATKPGGLGMRSVSQGNEVINAGERRTGNTSLSERSVERSAGTGMPAAVPPPQFVRGKKIPDSVSLIRLGNGDDATFAEANFSNYHAGINYLMQKYGSQRVNEAFAGSQFSPDRLELEASLNEHGREKLKPRPGAKRHDTFGAKNLREMEAIITGGRNEESVNLEIALAAGKTAFSIAKVALTLDVGAAISACQAASETLSLGEALVGNASLAHERASAARPDKTVPFPIILNEDEKLVYHTDKKMIARENFQNFYAGMKYLVAKYGVESIPGDLMDELITLSKDLEFVMEDDKALLPDQPPNGAREKQFSRRDLETIENLMTGRRGVEVAKTALKVAGAVLGTAAAVTGAVATFGAGAPAIPVAIGALISLGMAAKSDIETTLHVIDAARRT